MKRNVILITSGALTAQAKRDDLKTAGTQTAFDILSLSLDDIDLAIVDLGANFQSLNIIEALTHSKPNPPVIAFVDGKHADAIPELQERGALACLTKPFCADDLARVIETVCGSNPHHDSEPCDS